MSVTGNLADVALRIEYDQLPEEAVKHAKRVFIDSLACILGGFHSPTGISCRQAAHDMGGPPEATLIGETTRVSARSAVIANQGMLRFLDYNDDIEIAVGTGDVVSAHPSGSLPVAMAAAEMTDASGKQFLESMIAGYEVIGRMLEIFQDLARGARFPSRRHSRLCRGGYGRKTIRPFPRATRTRHGYRWVGVFVARHTRC